MITTHTMNVPGWADLSTPDPAAAREFYAALLGWHVETTDTPMGEYHIGKLGDLDVAGMMATPPGEESIPPAWTMFVVVPDVAESLAAASAVGGTVLQAATPIPDGRVGVLADPSGAMFGVMSYDEPPPDVAWLSHRPGSVCWFDLLTRDPMAAVPFYEAAFGWEAETHHGLPFTTFSLHGDAFAGMLAMPDEVPADVPSHWSVYFAVEDADAAEARAIDLGATVVRPTFADEGGPGRIAVLADPTGATFDLLESHD